MKKTFILVVIVFGLGIFQTRAAVFLPSLLGPIRSAIIDELDFLTNSPSLTPEERRRARLLNQARRNMDRPGRPSLFGDVQILTSLSTSLGHAFPDGEFDLLLQLAIADYRDALTASTLESLTAVGQLPPSGSATVASNTLVQVVTTLDQLDPTASIAVGIQTLVRSAVRLRSVEGLISRARTVQSRGDRMSALVGSRTFQADAGLTALYNPAAQVLTISGRDVTGTSNQTITLHIANVRTGTTSHSLSGPSSGTYATYLATSATGSSGFTSSSGIVTVTVDANASVVSGRFSFNASAEAGGTTAVRVTSGQFLLRLQ